jgi:tetratricopeptide (TPR) repeat protein
MIEEDPSTSKKSKSAALIIVGILSLVIFMSLLIYSEVENTKGKETQQRYHSEIKNIEKYLNEGNCTEAASEYARAKETREVIVKRGLYYSLDSHTKQAHAIEIAECFAKNKEFDNAVGILDSEQSEDPEYLLRASIIYQNGGALSKAQEAKSKAEKY